jgi:hypothetical protein
LPQKRANRIVQLAIARQEHIAPVCVCTFVYVVFATLTGNSRGENDKVAVLHQSVDQYMRSVRRDAFCDLQALHQLKARASIKGL